MRYWASLFRLRRNNLSCRQAASPRQREGQRYTPWPHTTESAPPSYSLYHRLYDDTEAHNHRLAFIVVLSPSSRSRWPSPIAPAWLQRESFGILMIKPRRAVYCLAAISILMRPVTAPTLSPPPRAKIDLRWFGLICRLLIVRLVSRKRRLRLLGRWQAGNTIIRRR